MNINIDLSCDDWISSTSKSEHLGLYVILECLSLDDKLFSINIQVL